MYWIQSQEPFSGIEIDKLIENHGVTQAKLVFYDDLQGKKEYVRFNQPLVTLSREKYEMENCED